MAEIIDMDEFKGKTTVLYYYIPDTKKEEVTNYLKEAAKSKYTIEMFYEFVIQEFLHDDVVVTFGEHYVEPTDEICIKLDLKKDEHGDECIMGFSYDYKEVKEKKSDDPSFGEVLFTTSLFFLTFLLGRATSPYKKFDPRRDKIKWPDMRKFGGNLEGVSKEDFYKVSDYYNDVFSETLRINNLYVCKGKKRRK